MRKMCGCGERLVHKRMFLCDECQEIERRGDRRATELRLAARSIAEEETGTEWSQQRGRLVTRQGPVPTTEILTSDEINALYNQLVLSKDEPQGRPELLLLEPPSA